MWFIESDCYEWQIKNYKTGLLYQAAHKQLNSPIPWPAEEHSVQFSFNFFAVIDGNMP